MKVYELVEELRKFPQDFIVVCGDPEMGHPYAWDIIKEDIICDDNTGKVTL